MLILYLLNEAKEIKCESKLQRIVYLLNKEKNILTGHSFLEYTTGCHSNELKHDLEALKQFEYITINQEKQFDYFDFGGQISVYKITRNGQEVIKQENIINETEKKMIKEIIKEWNSKNVNEILDYVNRNYRKEGVGGVRN